jgi:hypothetical protein
LDSPHSTTRALVPLPHSFDSRIPPNHLLGNNSHTFPAHHRLPPPPRPPLPPPPPPHTGFTHRGRRIRFVNPKPFPPPVCSNLEAHNLTGQILPQNILNVLGLGSKFIATPHCSRDQAWSEFSDSFEKLERKIRIKYYFQFVKPSDDVWTPSKLYIAKPWWNPPEKDIPATLNSIIQQVKSEISPIIKHRIKEFFDQKQPDNLSQDERLALGDLKKLRDTYIVTQTDKNLGLCVLLRSTYDSEVLKTLSDPITYAEQFETPLVIIERVLAEARSLFRDLGGFLRQEEWTFLLSHYDLDNVGNFSTSPMRLLPKVHKPPPLPFRPIVNAIHAPTTPFSIIINERLQSIMRAQPTYIADSTSFVKLLQNSPVPVDRRLGPITIFTFDIVSLYPNIPIQYALNRLPAFLFKHGLCWETSTVMVRILYFVLTNNYISFKDRVFHQRDGTAMGTSCAVVFANLFLSELETEWLADFKSDIFLFKRFLDDGVGLAYLNQADTIAMLEKYGILHPNIKITYSTSETSAIFLDLEIFRDESFLITGLFKTKVYSKPNNKFLYLPSTSFHPEKVKSNFIRSEILRYLRLSSDEKDFLASVEKFFTHLTARGYNLISLRKIKSTITFADRASALNPKRSTILSIPNQIAPPRPLFFVTQLNPFSRKLNFSSLLNNSFTRLNNIASFPLNFTVSFRFPKHLPREIDSK